MLKMMNEPPEKHVPGKEASVAEEYTCLMHPEIREDNRGGVRSA